MIDTSKLQFLGYSVGIFPGSIDVKIPHYYNLNKFMRDNILYNNSSINTFVLIESNNYFFLGTINRESMSTQDTNELIQDDKKDTETPELYIDVLSEINPITLCLIKSSQNFPVIHSKVYVASNKLINTFISETSKDVNIQRQRYISKIDNTNKYSKNKRKNLQNKLKSKFINSIVATHDFASLIQNNMDVNLSLNTLFSRHLGIVGSTGSGKSYTAAKLILELIKHNQHVILVDPTGEYKNIIEKIRNHEIRTFTNKNISLYQFIIGNSARIPYFDLDKDELYKLIRPSSGVQEPKLKASINDLKFIRLYNSDKEVIKSFMKKKHFNCKNIIIHDKYDQEYLHIVGNGDNISNINKLKKNIIYLLNNYYRLDMGYNFSELPIQLKEECYDVYNNTNRKARYINQNMSLWKYCASLSTRIDTFCHNKILNKYFCKWPVKNNSRQLFKSLNYKFVMSKNITYIDLENVPLSNDITEIIGDYIARKLLLSFINNKNKIKDPAVLFIDEAHDLIKRDNPNDMYNLHYFDLIAKEGRKYGLFMTLITQSPNDLSRDVLTQFGTFIIHHLGNDIERQKVTSSLPYNSNLDKYISSLNTGEAIISSNGLYNPLMIRIHKPSVPPKSNTPKFK